MEKDIERIKLYNTVKGLTSEHAVRMKAVEEIGELILDLAKIQNAILHGDELDYGFEMDAVGEMADVLIMFEQLSQQIGSLRLVESAYKMKINRLRDRVAAGIIGNHK